MKKVVLILFFAYTCTVLFAQQSIYVSARGDEDNTGLSEREPVKSLYNAFLCASYFGINKITIIGTLDLNSEAGNYSTSVFKIDNSINEYLGKATPGEILITGKPGASEAERAVLSARGSGKAVVLINNLQVRFEHIEISGGEGGAEGYGLFLAADTQVTQITLGPGTVVRSNSGVGIMIARGTTCIIDGGVIQDNNFSGVAVFGLFNLRNGTIRGNRASGVVVGKDGQFTMSGGTIRDNNSSNSGGGVAIDTGGQFTMSGGSITGNRTAVSGGFLGGGVLVNGGLFTMTGGSISNNRASGGGGGVAVFSGGRFDQAGGTVSNNTAPQEADIYRQ